MGDSRVEGNFSIFIDRGDPMAQRHRRLDNLIAQHRESSRFEDGVIDYNKLPLSDQLKKQAQLATVNIQRKPPIVKENEQKVLAEAFRNHTRRLGHQMYFRTQVLTLLNIALFTFILILGLRLFR